MNGWSFGWVVIWVGGQVGGGVKWVGMKWMCGPSVYVWSKCVYVCVA